MYQLSVFATGKNCWLRWPSLRHCHCCRGVPLASLLSSRSKHLGASENFSILTPLGSVSRASLREAAHAMSQVSVPLSHAGTSVCLCHMCRMSHDAVTRCVMLLSHASCLIATTSELMPAQEWWSVMVGHVRRAQH